MVLLKDYEVATLRWVSEKYPVGSRWTMTNWPTLVKVMRESLGVPDEEACRSTVKLLEDMHAIETLPAANQVLALRATTLGLQYVRESDASTERARAHESIEIDLEPFPLRADLPDPITIFISCGSQASERESGKWLYSALSQTRNAKPFYWEEESPGSDAAKSLQQRLLERARSSDAFVAFLHFRGREDLIPFSLACYDEISSAVRGGIPSIIFRTSSVPLVGMILPQTEAPSVRSISEVAKRMESWLPTIHPRLQPTPPSLGWGTVSVNSVPRALGPEGFSVVGSALKDQTRHVTVASVVNDGNGTAHGVRAWIEIDGRWLQLPWTIPNSDKTRQEKDIHETEEQYFDVCGWNVWDQHRVLPHERGWDNPRDLGDPLTNGIIPVRLKVTMADRPTLGPRNANLLRLTDISSDGTAPLIRWL